MTTSGARPGSLPPTASDNRVDGVFARFMIWTALAELVVAVALAIALAIAQAVGKL